MDEKKIIELAEQGKTIKEISNELNLKRAEAQECLRNYFIGSESNEQIVKKNFELQNILLEKKIEFLKNKIIDLIEEGNGLSTIRKEIGFDNVNDTRSALNKIYFNGNIESEKLQTEVNELITNKRNVRKNESKASRSKRRIIDYFEKNKKMLEMRNEGSTLDEIGKVYGVSRERIRQILKKLDNNGPYDGFDILSKEEISNKKREKYANQKHAEMLKILEKHEKTLIRIYNSGLNMEKTKNDLNLSGRDIQGCFEILKKEGKISYIKPRKSQGLSAEENDIVHKTIVNMREEGAGLEKIAQTLGYSAIWVSLQIREMRDKGIYVPDNHNMANREYLRDWDKINNRSKEILNLIKSGVKRNSEIEKKLGLPGGTVSRHIKLYLENEVDEAFREADKNR